MEAEKHIHSWALVSNLPTVSIMKLPKLKFLLLVVDHWSSRPSDGPKKRYECSIYPSFSGFTRVFAPLIM